MKKKTFFVFFLLIFLIGCRRFPLDEPPDQKALNEINGIIKAINQNEKYLGENKAVKIILEALNSNPTSLYEFDSILEIWYEQHTGKLKVSALAYPTVDGIKTDISISNSHGSYFLPIRLTKIITGDPENSTNWKKLKKLYQDRFTGDPGSFYGMTKFILNEKINSLIEWVRVNKQLPFKNYYWGEVHPYQISLNDPDYYENEKLYFGNWSFYTNFDFDIPDAPIKDNEEYLIWIAADMLLGNDNSLATSWEISFLNKILPLILEAYHPSVLPEDAKKAIHKLKDLQINKNDNINSKRIYDIFFED